MRTSYAINSVYNTLATVYVAPGRADEAKRLLTDLDRREPERWSAQLVLGWHAINWGDPDVALGALDRAEELRPGSPFVDFFRWRAGALDGRLGQADAAVSTLADGPSPTGAGGATWRGRSRPLPGTRGPGPRPLAAAAASYARQTSGRHRPQLRRRAAARLGRPREALGEADAARRLAPGDWPAWEGTVLGVPRPGAPGPPEEADRLAQELADHADLLPGTVEERYHHRLLGLLARDAAGRRRARRSSSTPRTCSPPRGLPWHRHRLPDHAALWYELADVHRPWATRTRPRPGTGEWSRAANEHIYYPIEYVRSHYYLAGCSRRGRPGRGPGRLPEFPGLWGDGEIDREQVADARRAATALR